MPRQQQLFPTLQFGVRSRSAHGGSVGIGERKIARPIDTRRPMHVVLRSSRATGSWSLRRRATESRLHVTMRSLASRCGVRVYQYANAGNHLHLLLRAKRRCDFQRFLRAFAGVAARLATGARKGSAVGRFWDTLAFSRIVHWGRDFGYVRSYIVQNELESHGLLSYRPRRTISPRSRAPDALVGRATWSKIDRSGGL